MSRLRVAVGPELPDFGSWNWLGVGLIDAMRPDVDAVSFSDGRNPPAANVVVFLKFKPTAEILTKLKRQNCRLVYVPVDIYGSSAEIDGDIDAIRQFDFIVVHCRRLLRYFSAARRVEYLDHPLKYVLSESRTRWEPGPMLWVGRRCNVAPIVAWANQRVSKTDLWILTESDGQYISPQDLGFRNSSNIRIGAWTTATHLEWLAQAGIAIDIKGSDFRSRHKPPAKVFDYIASGIPVLVNRGSSAALELTWRGMTPLYEDVSANGQLDLQGEYLNHCDAAVRETSAPKVVWNRWRQIIQELARS